jgi:DNA helicase-2/ATP-dependent DNA helicase PcrA
LAEAERLGYIAQPSRLGDSSPAFERVSPDVFQQGMTVMHPEYGPGKIVALSGAGKNRRATIQFATVGQKKIILSHSALRPAR